MVNELMLDLAVKKTISIATMRSIVRKIENGISLENCFHSLPGLVSAILIRYRLLANAVEGQ